MVPSTNNSWKKRLDIIAMVLASIILLSALGYFFYCIWSYEANISAIINSNQISIVKIGTNAATINFKTNSTGEKDFYVYCKYDEPQWHDGFKYATFFASRNLLKDGYNDLTFDMVNLKSGSNQTCFISLDGHVSIYIPEFRTIPEPTVETFKFYKKQPSTNKAQIIGSLETTDSTGLVWWAAYGTPTTPYKYTTPKFSVDGYKLEVEIDQLLDLTEEYKAKIVVEDACGKKYYSDPVIGQ